MKNHEPQTTAYNYAEACAFLRSGRVKHVRLDWAIEGDEFFRIASDWCDAGARIVKDNNTFVITLKGFVIPRQY